MKSGRYGEYETRRKGNIRTNKMENFKEYDESARQSGFRQQLETE